jgi:hypothetical protein
MSGLVAEALEKVFEEAAAASPAAASFLVVAIALAATPFDLSEEVLVGVAGRPLALLHEDAVELAPVEPDASAFRTGVDQDLAALGLDEARAVDWAPQWLAA